MKKYYVRYTSNFYNEYQLAWADDEHPIPDPEDNGWKLITKKEAVSLAEEATLHRRVYANFSGYADEYIYPWWINESLWEFYDQEYGHEFRTCPDRRRSRIIMRERDRIVDFA